MFRVALDQDMVLANLNKKWLEVYNQRYDDDLQPEEILEWDIDKLVKPECGMKIYDIIKEPGFLLSLEPMHGSQVGVQFLVDSGCEVFMVTSPLHDQNCYFEKVEWMYKYFPMIPQENFVLTRNKAIVNADYLVDDALHNIQAFHSPPDLRIGIIFDYPWNRKLNAKIQYKRVKNWAELTTFFRTGVDARKMLRQRGL